MDEQGKSQYQAQTPGLQPKSTRRPGLPAEIAACIRERIVDLSTASEFSKKRWEIYRQLVPKIIEERGANRYELSEKFFRRFEQVMSGNIRAGIRRQSDTPGDLIAQALCDVAYEEERAWIDSEPDAPQDWPVWPSSRPILEAWQGFGSLRVPELNGVTLEQAERRSKWRPRQGFDLPMVRIEPDFNKDRDSLPKLTIEVEGAPVCLLMLAKYRLRDQESHRAMISDAKQLWGAIVLWTASALGLANTEKGRPKTNLGYEAAFLHDQLRLSWLQVAQKLCGLNHRHSHSCRENYRKQAEQYWKRLRKSLFPEARR